VLTLAILRSGLSAIGVSPHVHEIVTGTILLAVAVFDAPDLARRIIAFRLDRKERTQLS
jgi:ribose/xylose/arabinose/galactoside ABC-type transport system permease subunit